jgi:Fibronectin type III domain
VRRAALLLIPLAAAGAVAVASDGPDPGRASLPDGFRVARVSVHGIALRWQDTEGESRYEVRRRERGDDRWHVREVPRDATRLRVRGLERGTVHQHQIRACEGGACSAWSPRRIQATLLARYNGPHPSPRCPILPGSDEFHRDVSSAPLHPRSDEIIDRILAEGGDSLHPDFGSFLGYGIPYVVVPGNQPRVPIGLGTYRDESDRGPYPVPPGAPIEGGDDDHVLVVQRDGRDADDDCRLYELYIARYRDGPRNRWTAAQGSVFDLGRRLPQRPRFWTSADAAGLPIFPGLARYEEVARGEIDHAIRITFQSTRRAFIDPATHFASDDCDRDLPSMGLRLRLKASYPIGDISGQARVIATALQRFGAIVADNGSNFFISGSTDRRWNDDNLNQLKEIPGRAFEVVAPRGPVVDDC